jgi:hypothetical protein
MLNYTNSHMWLIHITQIATYNLTRISQNLELHLRRYVILKGWQDMCIPNVYESKSNHKA